MASQSEPNAQKLGAGKLEDLKGSHAAQTLKEKIETQTVLMEEGDPKPPCINPPRYNFLYDGDFTVSFNCPDETPDKTLFKQSVFINPRYIISVLRPSFNMKTGAIVENTVTILTPVVEEKHYFGKPSTYRNIFTEDEIVDMARTFNESGDCASIVVDEVASDTDGRVHIVTEYTNPKIVAIDFGVNAKYSEEIKAYNFVFEFEDRITYHRVDEEDETPIKSEMPEETKR